MPVFKRRASTPPPHRETPDRQTPDHQNPVRETPDHAMPGAGSIANQAPFIATVCSAAGLPTTDLTDERIIQFVLPTCIAAFSGGELQMTYNTDPPPDLWELYGRRDCTEGKFYEHLLALCRQPPDSLARDVRSLQAMVGNQLAAGFLEDDAAIRVRESDTVAPRLARIEGMQIVFGGAYRQGEYREQLEVPVHYLMQLEPGVGLRHTLNEQLELIRRSAEPFNYICVSDRPFTTQFLESYLELRSGQAVGSDKLSRAMVEAGVVVQAKGPLVRCMDFYVERNRAMGRPHGPIDAIVFVGVEAPGLTLDEAQKVFSAAQFVLRPGGVFLVGFPPGTTQSGQAAMEDMIGAGFAAGFSPASKSHIGTSNLENPRLPIFTLFRKESGPSAF
jgi:hypothetical protein